MASRIVFSSMRVASRRAANATTCRSRPLGSAAPSFSTAGTTGSGVAHGNVESLIAEKQAEVEGELDSAFLRLLREKQARLHSAAPPPPPLTPNLHRTPTLPHQQQAFSETTSKRRSSFSSGRDRS